MTRPTLLIVLLIGTLLTLSAPAALAVDKIVVVGLFKDTAVVRIDGQQRLLRVGNTSPEGVTLIAADSEAAVLEIDGEQQRYPLGAHISSQFAKPASGPVMRVWPNPASGLYIADGHINGYAMEFVIDTGATLVSMNSNQAKRLGINYRLEGEKGLSQTASGTNTIYVIELDSVRLGRIELENVRAAVHEGDFPAYVLLGNSFLDRINLQRDGKVLELQAPP